MKIGSEEYIRKQNFVRSYLAPCMKAATLLSAEYCVGGEIKLSKEEKMLYDEKHIFVNDEYIVLKASNGYRYFINVTANSLASIAEAAFHEAACK